MNIDYYNNKLRNLLQSKVVFRCHNKTVKTGTIKLFNIKQYFIKFYIEQDNTKETKILELPYPYEINTDKDNNFSFNYRLSCLTGNIPVQFLSALKKNKSTHKFYDSIITITPFK
jgi:hypothetical protein